MNNRSSFPLICLFTLSLFFAYSCKRDKKQNGGENVPIEAPVEADSIPATEENDTDRERDPEDFVVSKLGDNTYVLNPYDTLVIGKPFLQLFEGEIGDKKTQLWMLYYLPMNEGLSTAYSLEGFFYYDGQEYVRKIYFDAASRSGYVYEDDDNEDILFELVYTDNGVTVKEDSRQYALEKSNIEFTAHDHLHYTNVYCDEQGIMRAHWEYDFSYGIKNMPEQYKKLASAINRQEEGDAEKGSGHWIETQMQKSTPDDEDDYCYTMYSMSYQMPIFLDGNVFVVGDYTDTYMGGAHGMFNTTYYNYDVRTGELIDLEDIIDTEDAEFWKMHDKKARIEFGLEDYTEDNEIDKPSGFYMLPTGIFLFYPPYSMKGGFWEKEMFFTYDELKPYLKKEYYHLQQ